jgi:hypothetical protein
MTLLLVIPELDQLIADLDPTQGASLPQLPGLSALLRWGRSNVAQDWRASTLRFAGRAAHPTPAPSAVASWALPNVVTGASICMVTPLHVVAGMSRVHLAPDGILELESEEMASLSSAFAREFQAPDVQLQWVGSEAVLQAPFAAAAQEPDPLTLRGKSLQRDPALDANTRQLRRFGAEMEMWLAGLALNRQREQRGKGAVNCLWMWGGGLATAAIAGAAQTALCSTEPQDAWLQGLARVTDGLVGNAKSWQTSADASPRVVLLQASRTGTLPLLDWERDWFAPVAEAVRNQQLAALQLCTGQMTSQIPRAVRLWPWQRPLPWWQQLAHSLRGALASTQ